MKLRKRNLRRIIIAVVFILLAGVITTMLNAALASRNPVAALPEMRVIYKDAPLPYEYICLQSYSWQFLFINKSGDANAPDWWKYFLDAGPVVPGSPLDIEFTYPCQSLTVSRADEGSDLFVEMGGVLRTPLEAGVYTYRVDANWGWRGSVRYYFKIEVRTG